MKETITRKAIDGNSPRYWQEQREGFAKINRIHDVFVEAERDGDYQRMDEATIEGASHPGVVRILTAQGLTIKRPYWNSYPVILNKQDVYAKAKDIPEFRSKKKPR